MRTWLRGLYIAAFIAGCGAASPVEDASSPDADAGLPEAGPLDGAVSDAGIRDAGVSIDAGASTMLPLGTDVIVPVGAAPGIDIYSVMRGDQLLFEHYDEALTEGELRRVVIVGGEPVGDPEPLALADVDQLVGSPSLVTLGGVDHLYTITAATGAGPARVQRRPWSEGAIGPATTVELPEPMTLLSWPRFVGLADGRVAMVYRDVSSVVKLAMSDDGLRFDAPQTMGPVGAQPELGQAGDGTFIFTYQVGSGSEIVSYRRVSTNGTVWTDPELVTDAGPNVHDTDVFARLDGRADLYFIHPDSAAGFDLWRRCVDAEGTLGPVELVVDRSWGNLAKPRAHRLADGSIQLTFVEQNSGHLLFTTRLVGDALCPLP